LIAEKQKYLKQKPVDFSAHSIRAREEIAEQIRALNDLKIMAQSYGIDISEPAKNAQEAVQKRAQRSERTEEKHNKDRADCFLCDYGRFAGSNFGLYGTDVYGCGLHVNV